MREKEGERKDSERMLVIGREPWSSGYGREFESLRRILDGHDIFSH